MDLQYHLCNHSEKVIDEKEGQSVCTQCGVVLDIVFVEEFSRNKVGHTPLNNSIEYEIYDILDKIHISRSFIQPIYQHYCSKYKKHSQNNILFSVYKVLNDNYQFNISLQDLCNITGAQKNNVCSVQKMNENIFLDISEMAEKYCSMLKLDFKNKSLIKEELKSIAISGHQPMTIIAGCLYMHCKAHKIKISIKKISEITSVSPISIQRYLKHNHASSQR